MHPEFELPKGFPVYHSFSEMKKPENRMHCIPLDANRQLLCFFDEEHLSYCT
jgi:hypothetical protein